MLCLGQPAVQFEWGMDGRTVKMTVFLSVRDGKKCLIICSHSVVLHSLLSL